MWPVIIPTSHTRDAVHDLSPGRRCIPGLPLWIASGYVDVASMHGHSRLVALAQATFMHGKDRMFILAGGHVRASAGALAVHTALIPCVCACVCVRYQTPFSSRHESVPSLFLSTGKHAVGGQLPRVFFSALPGQSRRPSKPTTPQKTVDFSVSFRQYSESNLRSMQWTREAKNRSFNVQTVK